MPALRRESSLPASAVAVGVLLPEVLRNVSFFVQLMTGRRVSGLTDYMFEARLPLDLRALSLFHVFLPVLLVWMVHVLGYDPAAWVAVTALAWVVLPLSYFFTDPEDNVNWVFGPGAKPQKRMAPLLYLGLLMVGFPLLIYLPTYWLLQGLFG